VVDAVDSVELLDAVARRPGPFVGEAILRCASQGELKILSCWRSCAPASPNPASTFTSAFSAVGRGAGRGVPEERSRLELVIRPFYRTNMAAVISWTGDASCNS
jgi:hypothetical protein